METIREEAPHGDKKYDKDHKYDEEDDDEDVSSEDSHRSKRSRRSRHSHDTRRHSHDSKRSRRSKHSHKSRDSKSSIPDHVVRDLQSEVVDSKHDKYDNNHDYDDDDDDEFDDDDDSHTRSHRDIHKHRHKHRHAQKHTTNHKFVPRLQQHNNRMLNGGNTTQQNSSSLTNQQNQNTNVLKSRQWANIPPNNLNIKEVWSKIIDPSSWWCVGAVTILAIVLSVFIVLYFKPSLALNQSNTNKKGSLDWKKVLAICFIVGIAVFGVSAYFRYKLQN